MLKHDPPHLPPLLREMMGSITRHKKPNVMLDVMDMWDIKYLQQLWQ